MALNSTTLGVVWAVVWSLAMTSVAQAQEADAATRAQRDAANPLRMIIEAGKLKVRQKSPEAEPEPAAKPATPARPPAPKPAAPASPALAAAPSPPTGKRATTSVAEPAPMPASQVAAAAAPEAAEPAPEAPPGAGAPIPAAVPAPAAEASPAAAAAPERQLAIAAPALPVAPPPAAAPVRVALELADYVEPVLNERLRRRLKGDGEVVIAFTVQADGSVTDPAVRSASDKVLEEAALDAVRQWRYQPIAAAQPHTVQLVFKFKD